MRELERAKCSGCGRRITDPSDITEREVRDLPCFQYRTTVVIELYRVRCPECGLKIEKVDQLPSKARFSKRFEEAVGEACESASARRVAATVFKCQRFSGRRAVLRLHSMDLGHVQPFIALATAIVSLTTALVPYLFKKNLIFVD